VLHQHEHNRYKIALIWKLMEWQYNNQTTSKWNDNVDSYKGRTKIKH